VAAQLAASQEGLISMSEMAYNSGNIFILTLLNIKILDLTKYTAPSEQ
jgi:hypothetical protein